MRTSLKKRTGERLIGDPFYKLWFYHRPEHNMNANTLQNWEGLLVTNQHADVDGIDFDPVFPGSEKLDLTPEACLFSFRISPGLSCIKRGIEGLAGGRLLVKGLLVP